MFQSPSRVCRVSTQVSLKRLKTANTRWKHKRSVTLVRRYPSTTSPSTLTPPRRQPNPPWGDTHTQLMNSPFSPCRQCHIPPGTTSPRCCCCARQPSPTSALQGSTSPTRSLVVHSSTSSCLCAPSVSVSAGYYWVLTFLKNLNFIGPNSRPSEILEFYKVPWG